jgi:hypothetical protein
MPNWKKALKASIYSSDSQNAGGQLNLEGDYKQQVRNANRKDRDDEIGCEPQGTDAFQNNDEEERCGNDITQPLEQQRISGEAYHYQNQFSDVNLQPQLPTFLKRRFKAVTSKQDAYRAKE